MNYSQQKRGTSRSKHEYLIFSSNCHQNKLSIRTSYIVVDFFCWYDYLQATKSIDIMQSKIANMAITNGVHWSISFHNLPIIGSSIIWSLDIYIPTGTQYLQSQVKYHERQNQSTSNPSLRIEIRSDLLADGFYLGSFAYLSYKYEHWQTNAYVFCTTII